MLPIEWDVKDTWVSFFRVSSEYTTGYRVYFLFFVYDISGIDNFWQGIWDQYGEDEVILVLDEI